jgi:CubicO group peptidase (beta-lactamase class C family)
MSPEIAKGQSLEELDGNGSDLSGLEEFDRSMRRFMSERRITAGSLAVTCRGRLVLARAYSDPAADLRVTPTSLFRIASLSKPLTATAVLGLVQDGLLELRTPILDVLDLRPAVGWDREPRIDQITVAHLLQHLGGWDRDGAFDPMFRDHAIAGELNLPLPIARRDIRTYMASRPLQHAPGTTYAYSNFGYSLLGRIIERVTGGSYEAFVRQRLFEPLRVSRPALGRTLRQYRLPDEVVYRSTHEGRSVFAPGDVRVPSPYGAWNLENMDAHGGWVASAIDLVRFAAAFNTPTEYPILSESMIETAFGIPVNLGSGEIKPGVSYYGCGWSVRDWGDGRRNTWHNGSLPGTHTLLVRRWKGDLNWCALFNQRDDPSGLNYSDIDPLLHKAADRVGQWPDHDLFNRYL